jgi:hypothetical protein
MVAGMHRSGTSLLCQHLSAMGVEFNGNLLPPSKSNTKGYYEDLSLIGFHDRMIERTAKNWRDRSNLGKDRHGWDIVDQNEGRAILKSLSGSQQLVGAKDPRTSLFLEQWADLAPEAFFLLPFRHPGQVCESLLRRGDIYEECPSTIRAINRALSLWKIYNTRCFSFHQQNASESLLIRIPDDVQAGRIESLSTRIGKLACRKLKVPDTVYNESLLKKRPRRLVEMMYHARLDVQRLWKKMCLYHQELSRELDGFTRRDV